jgi:hypothetical protein
VRSASNVSAVGEVGLQRQRGGIHSRPRKRTVVRTSSAARSTAGWRGDGVVDEHGGGGEGVAVEDSAAGRGALGHAAVPSSVVLDEAEFVVLGVGHHDHHAIVVVVPFPGEPAAETADLRHGAVDVVHGDVEVNSYLAVARLGHRLEHQPGLGVAALAEVDPALFGGSGRAPEQSAPESGNSFGLETVDRDAGPYVDHVPILAASRL